MPLCFVLPSAEAPVTQALHREYVGRIVGPNDVLINVFPKHQQEVQAIGYAQGAEEILDPAKLLRRLCGCRALVASRLHGVILGLHAGVPTLAAWPVGSGSKVPDLMVEVMRLPDQFFLVDGNVTRETLDRHVKHVRTMYSGIRTKGRRGKVFRRLRDIAARSRRRMGGMLRQVFHIDGRKRRRHGVAIEPLAGSHITFWDGNITTSAPVIGSYVRPKESPGSIEEYEVKHERQNGAQEQAVRNEVGKADADAGGSLSQGGAAHSTLAPVKSTPRQGVLVAVGIITLVALLGIPPLTTFPHHGEMLERRSVLSTRRSCAVDNPKMTLSWPCCAGIIVIGANYVSWVILAVGCNSSSKAYLMKTRNPAALLACQGWFGLVVLWALNVLARCCGPSTPSSARYAWDLHLWKVRRTEVCVWRASVLHAANAVLTNWSVLIGGVAATHALKALEPVAAALFSRWMLKSRLSSWSSASVTVIVAGLVFLLLPSGALQWLDRRTTEDGESSGKEDAGETTGEALALPAFITALACCCVALRNVSLKEADRPTPPPLSLFICSLAAALAGTIMLLLPFLPWSWERKGGSLLQWSGVKASLCFVGYNLASFNLLVMLSPVGHAVGNSTKRVFLFASGLLMLGESATWSPQQVGGAFLAFTGVTCYYLAGFSWRRQAPPEFSASQSCQTPVEQ